MTDFEAFMEWLQDHNYAKVNPCQYCHFWGDKTKDKSYEEPERHCRRHGIKTWPTDYCNYFVEVKK